MPYKDIRKQSQYQTQWMRKRRLTWLEDNGPCVKCGSKELLTVDHVDPRKKTSHRIWSWKKERRDLELLKCQVLCTKCHKVKTKTDRYCRGKQNKEISASKYKGVFSCRNKWRAGLCVNGKKVHLGVFSKQKEAAYAYDAAVREHLGKAAYTNF